MQSTYFSAPKNSKHNYSSIQSKLTVIKKKQGGWQIIRVEKNGIQNEIQWIK